MKGSTNYDRGAAGRLRVHLQRRRHFDGVNANRRLRVVGINLVPVLCLAMLISSRTSLLIAWLHSHLGPSTLVLQILTTRYDASYLSRWCVVYAVCRLVSCTLRRTHQQTFQLRGRTYWASGSNAGSINAYRSPTRTYQRSPRGQLALQAVARSIKFVRRADATKCYFD